MLQKLKDHFYYNVYNIKAKIINTYITHRLYMVYETGFIWKLQAN